mgnify:CR=1 FL=1
MKIHENINFKNYTYKISSLHTEKELLYFRKILYLTNIKKSDNIIIRFTKII